MGNLVKVSLHRVDTQDNVDEWEITLYSYDGRGLVTREVNALGAVTTYAYDGNGNLVTKTDADGYVTTNTYTKLDMVSSINYNGGKEVSYQYNAVGDLVQMTDWTGTTAFEVDLLRRITKTTDTKGNVVEYSYDAVGNQTGIRYPDDTTVTKTYDLLGQLKTVTEDDGRTTTCTYDGMGRMSRMEYPHGWVEEYHYDAIGQLTSVEDTDPTRQNMKQQKHGYRYDDCGNMVYEYMRGNGTREATIENTYAYDALHRVISAHEDYGNKTRTYTYDSLGNLTFETEHGNKSVDYRLNNLNQITQSSDDGWKTSTAYIYDLRGNLTQETYTKNKKVSIVGAYIYDETNKMVSGTNANGEVSNYIYNGLGALVENQWIITKNEYGYHDVDAGNAVVTYPATGLHNSSTVIKQFIMDYTSETFEPLMEHEINGFDYRYVYGNDRLSVDIKGVTTSSGNLIENGDHIRLYYHMDYLGTADYLTSPVSGKITSWTHYNEWGESTHNAVLKCGQRELDMVKRYATHDFDSVLGQYYAKARFYDAGSRRFTAMDPIKDGLNWYAYCENNPVVYIDEFGLVTRYVSANSVRMRSGPGLSYTTLYYLSKNTKVDYLWQKKSANGYNWAKVKYNGRTGWIADIYLRYPTAQETTQEWAHQIIANDAFVYVTQNGMFPELFYVAGFTRDYNGVYHARQDALQRFGGYNDFYDTVFNYATSMLSGKYEFTYDNNKYIFWAWKGDYLNLGAGAELGIYKASGISGHWLVDRSLALPMTLKLVDNSGKELLTYAPTEKQWWITGFNPSYQNVLACNLKATFTVNFSTNQSMYREFKLKMIRDGAPWVFNDKTHIATLVF